MLEVVELLEPVELLKCMIAEVFPELLDAFGCDTAAEVLCIGVSCDALAPGSEGLPKMPLSSRCSSGQWPSVAKHRKAGADDFMEDSSDLPIAKIVATPPKFQSVQPLSR